MLFGRKMSPRGFWIRLAICLAIDLVDFTIGRGLILVPIEEVPVAGIMVLMFGFPGLVYLAEIAELTEQFDAFIPMATLICLWVGWQNGFLAGRTPPPPAGKDITPPGPKPRNSPRNW